MADQCGVSNTVRQHLEAKTRRRAELREMFLKQTTDPHQHATGGGGAVFDSGIHRFMAMRDHRFEHFKPSGYQVRFGLFFFLMPFLVFGYAVHWERSTKEHKYRTGQVAYKDRLFKFA